MAWLLCVAAMFVTLKGLVECICLIVGDRLAEFAGEELYILRRVL